MKFEITSDEKEILISVYNTTIKHLSVKIDYLESMKMLINQDCFEIDILIDMRSKLKHEIAGKKWKSGSLTGSERNQINIDIHELDDLIIKVNQHIQLIEKQ